MEKFPIQLMPILMRDRACRIDASGATESTATTTSSFLGGPWGPIGLVGPIGAVESNGVSTELYGRIPIQPDSSPLATGANRATGSNVDWRAFFWILDSQRLDCRPWRIDPNGSLVDEVSFKIKDTFQSTRESRNTWS